MVAAIKAILKAQLERLMESPGCGNGNEFYWDGGTKCRRMTSMHLDDRSRV